MATMQVFMGIMVFYAIITYIIGPIVGYYFGGRTLNSAGNGFIVGSLISIILWYSFGQKIVNR